MPEESFNDHLKELAKECGIQINLTSYVSRHSFSTYAKLHKIPVEATSEMLGYTSIKTTQVYLDPLPGKTSDNYNQAYYKRSKLILNKAKRD